MPRRPYEHLFAAPFACGVVALDVVLRRAFLRSFEPRDAAVYAGCAALSAFFWASLFWLAAWHERRAVRNAALAAGALLASVVLGGQFYLFFRYGNYLDHRAALVGTGMLPSVKQQLWFDRATFGKTMLAPPVAWTALVLAARAASRAPRTPTWLASDLAASALFVAVVLPVSLGRDQGRTPDTLYLSALGQVLADASPLYAKGHAARAERVPGPRTPAPVPPLRTSARHNLVFIVTESVRAESACSEYDAGCETTPFTNRLLPNRVGLSQMRSLDSTTALSLAVLWLGIEPNAPRADFHTRPIVWEYATAAGYDTGYFTSQNLFFANSGRWLEGVPIRLRISGTELDPDASYETGADDGVLVDAAITQIAALREPYFAVVHLSNTHFPYRIGDDAPFETDPKYKARHAQLNRYEDAIYRQDAFVARLVEGVRAQQREVGFVFVSDHGEQLNERGAVGHTGTLFDVEVRVPFWIDAPPSMLTPADRNALSALAHAPTTQIDVLPTVLDLMGIWTSPELSALRGGFAGESLLRGGSPPRTWTITNCSPFWTCAFKNWGAMRGARKLLAHQGDDDWQCFDVLADPAERHNLGAAACADLRSHVEAAIPGKPF